MLTSALIVETVVNVTSSGTLQEYNYPGDRPSPSFNSLNAGRKYFNTKNNNSWGEICVTPQTHVGHEVVDRCEAPSWLQSCHIQQAREE